MYFLGALCEEHYEFAKGDLTEDNKQLLLDRAYQKLIVEMSMIGAGPLPARHTARFLHTTKEAIEIVDRALKPKYGTPLEVVMEKAKEAFMEHIKECEDCREKYEEYQKTGICPVHGVNHDFEDEDHDHGGILHGDGGGRPHKNRLQRYFDEIEDEQSPGGLS